MTSLLLEMRYALREQSVRAALLFVFCIAGYALLTGAMEISQQQLEIQSLKQEAYADQRVTLAEQADAGGAAYYVQHLTYDPPSRLAFAALEYPPRSTLETSHSYAGVRGPDL